MFEITSAIVTNFVDILLVAFFTYNIYKLLRHTRATPVLIGLGILLAISILSRIFHLETLNWLFESVSGYILIAVIVILQPELRRVFYKLGQTKWYRFFFQIRDVPVEEIIQALLQFSEEKTGALVVLVNRIGLRHLSEAGIQLQARVSRELLVAAFYGENPLHDGAVLVEGSIILSAGTYLPLSSSTQLRKTHGARHRAALGISEESDALALVVSEEKGYISACYLGVMKEKLDVIKLKSLLSAFNNNKLNEEWDKLFG